MKKRLLSALLAAAVALSLTACGPWTVYGTPAGSDPDKPGPVPQKTPVDHSVILTTYPEQFQIPDPSDFGEDFEGYSVQWRKWREENWARSDDAVEGDVLRDYLLKTIPEFLTGTQGNEVCSPVNLYVALAMLTELTEGNSRTQLLDLLGEESIESLRQTAASVWNTCYRSDGAVTSIPASSIWMDTDMEYVQKTLELLAEHYHASSYQGDMGSAELNAALQNWLNEQTGGLLEEQAAGEGFTPDTIFALATTLYFRAKWSNEFNPDRTEPGEFTILSPDGGTIPCEFMRSSGSANYYWSDDFSAVGRRLENGGTMWLILPDGDVSVSRLLDDPTTMEFILANGEWEDSKFLTVNLWLPKFDISGKKDLCSSLQRLGIGDVFDPSVSDFTPLTQTMSGIFVSQISHAARVTIDEEGVTAAAYTVIAEAGAAMPPEEEVDFILNRPFLFAVTAEGGLPLFMGVVQTPA